MTSPDAPDLPRFPPENFPPEKICNLASPELSSRVPNAMPPFKALPTELIVFWHGYFLDLADRALTIYNDLPSFWFYHTMCNFTKSLLPLCGPTSSNNKS